MYACVFVRVCVRVKDDDDDVKETVRMITIAPCQQTLRPRYLSWWQIHAARPPRQRLFSRLNSNDFVAAGSPLALRLHLQNCSRGETSPLERFGARRLAWLATHDE